MNVSYHNFQQAYDRFNQIINQDNCEFVSFDLEMTGIVSNSYQQDYDLPFEIYNKKKQVAQKFSIIQMGFSLFTKETNQNSDNDNNNNQHTYTCYPFNFYVFPRKNDIYDPVIQMQLGSIEFNTLNNMDYNKWIKEGISFIPKQIAENKLQKLIDQIIHQNKQESSLRKEEVYNKLDQERKNLASNILEDINKWRNDPDQIEDYQTKGLRFFYIRDFIIKHINQTKTDGYIFAVVPSLNKSDYDLKIRKIKIEDNQVEQFKNEEFLKKFTDQVREKMIQEQFDFYLSFTKIMELVWNRKLPIIGHNCLFDHLFTYNTFFGSLPNYTDFKKQFIQLYPQFYDTKQIAEVLKQQQFLQNQNQSQEKENQVQNGSPSQYQQQGKTEKNDNQKQENQKMEIEISQVGETSLENLKKFVEQNPQIFTQKIEIKTTDEFKYTEDFYHQAGFDSCLTGQVYLNFLHNFEEITKEQKNQLNIRSKLYQINFDKEDQRKEQNQIWVIKDKAAFQQQNIQHNNLGNYNGNEFIQFIQIDQKRQELVKQNFKTQILQNYVQFSFQTNGYAFAALPEIYAQDPQIKGEFIRKAVNLKAQNFEVSSFADYIIKKQKMQSLE